MVIELLSVRSVNSRAHILFYSDMNTLTHTHIHIHTHLYMHQDMEPAYIQLYRSNLFHFVL